jgi:hypothetical protein
VDEVETLPHEVAQIAELAFDFVGSGDGVEPQERGQGTGIDLVGFDFGVGDGLEVLGMGKHEFDAVGFEEIVEPVPAGGTFDDGDVGSIEGAEIGQNALGDIGQPFLLDEGADRIDRGDETVVLMQIDTGVEHGGLLTEYSTLNPGRSMSKYEIGRSPFW